MCKKKYISWQKERPVGEYTTWIATNGEAEKAQYWALRLVATSFFDSSTRDADWPDLQSALERFARSAS
jgi:hypothetical protein